MIRKVLKWWILFFVWLCFGPDFPRIQYVAQAGLPLQSNLVYQTPELWMNYYAQFTKIILKGKYELNTSKLAILSALETGPRNGLY